MTLPVRRISWPGAGQAGWETLLSREWIVTNGLGGYASGTVCAVPTRRFHGLLIAALPAPQGRTMMLNHLWEEVRLAEAFGDQAASAPTPWRRSVRRRASPPPVGRTHTCRVPLRDETNAISDPSGEKTGAVFDESANVSRRISPDPTSRRCRSLCSSSLSPPSSVRVCANTTVLPSGERSPPSGKRNRNRSSDAIARAKNSPSAGQQGLRKD